MAERKPMGIGVIGQPDITFKRKFRWTLKYLDSATTKAM